MKPRVYLHIGLQKTGTSALQDWLASNESSLKKLGILYPNAGRKLKKHSFLYESIKSEYLDKALDLHWVQLEKELSNTKSGKVIISDEAFCDLTSLEIAALQEKLLNYEIKVVIYLREPRSFMVSLYKYNIRVGGIYYSFKEFLERNVGRFDFEAKIKRFSNFFGHENIIVKTYEKAKNDNLLIDFMKTIEISESEIEANLGKLKLRRVNSALDRESLLLIRTFNRLQFAMAYILGYSGKGLVAHERSFNTLSSFNKIRFLLSRWWMRLVKSLIVSIIRKKGIGILIRAVFNPFITKNQLYKESDMIVLHKQISGTTNQVFLESYYPELSLFEEYS